MRFLVLFICVIAGAQTANLISLTPAETSALSAAYNAQVEARKIADDKYQAYYSLTQKIRTAHKITGCGAFTGDFRWLITGAYSPLNSSSGVMTSPCRQ